MAINPTPIYSPPQYASVNNPIIWSVISDKTHMWDFKYVVDVNVIINSNLNIVAGTPVTTTVRIVPNQTGVGIIDVSSIVQSYINYYKFSAEEGTIDQYKGSNNIAVGVWIVVGEEYRLTETGILRQWTGDPFPTIGPPAIKFTSDLYSLYNVLPVLCIPSSLIHNDQTTLLTSGGSASYLARYATIGPFSGFTQSIVGKFLKRDSNVIEVGLNDRHTLSHINIGPAAAGGSTIQGLQYQVNYYDLLGNFSSMVQYNITTPGFGYTQDYIMNTFRCGPKDLGIGTIQYSYYEVVVRGATGISPVAGVTASETVRFNIIDYCEDLYPKIRLSFLNSLGGRDYYNFTMFYEASSNSTEKNYNQSDLNWTQTIPFVIPTSTIDSSSNWRRGGLKSFNKVVTRKFTIQSDYLDQEKVDFLSGIPESPSVWAYIGTQSVPYTVTVTNTEYTNKYVKQQKLVQVSFDCTLTKTQQKQNS